MSTLLIPREENLLISSDPANGAVNVSADGSYFEVQFTDGGLTLPREAVNVQVSVQEATVWWTVPNIITGVNDKMYITGPDSLDVLTAYVITIPQGLYDLSGLNEAIARELEQAGAKIDPDPLISLSPDEATSKVQMRFNYATVSVDFTPNNTPRLILGFDAQVYTPIPDNPVLAPNTALFNTVNYFLLHSDLVSRGIRFNSNYNQTIAQILIDVSPGSQIVSKPFNPPKVNANELNGTTRTVLRFWLTDDENRPVNTNGEFYSARIVLSWLEPIVM